MAAMVKLDQQEITGRARMVGESLRAIGQNPSSSNSRPLSSSRFWSLLLFLAVLATALPASLHAQAFQPIPALSFTMPVGGANPLPQVLTVASTGTNFNYSAVASTTTGGSWLSLSRSFGCCGIPTPAVVNVIVTAPTGLAAGTYSGKVVFTDVSNTSITLTVPVTLVVAPSTVAFPANLPGQLGFSLATNGKVLPSQSFQIRNAGSGTLSWTIAKSYGIGSGWLVVSASSGSGTTNIVVTVTPSAIPGAGLIPGAYTAQLAVQTSGGKVTIPIVIKVGSSVFRQMGAMNFSKAYGGGNPLPQLMTVASTGTDFNFNAVAVNSTGGNWLSINPASYGCCGISTPQGVTVTVNPSAALAAGTYTAEIIVASSDGTMAVVVPVTLAVNAVNTAFFDDLPGGMNFFLETGGNAPPGQALQIRNAGAGSLAWTLGGSTSDGGSWLAVSASSGTAPSTVTVSVNPANLPGAGETPGTYTGLITIQSATGRVTVPISVTVGDSVFRQANPLNFVKAYGGGNPLSQILTVASTGTNFAFNAVAVNSTGGNWLSITPSSYGCCGITSPQGVTVSVNADAALAVGTYTAQVIVKSSDGSLFMAVPVTLTVAPVASTFFDSLPGQLTFSMVTGGLTPPSQPIMIRNAGTGTLAWTGSTSTADGGAWLLLGAGSGTAPSILNAKINPANLPGQGLIPGTYTGQVLLKTTGQSVTVPISVIVGANVFRQTNPLNFTKPYGGGNPLPQVLTIASTGANFNFNAVAVSSTGGNWLTINPSSYGCCGIATPENITVSVNPSSALVAGTYSAEIIVKSSDGTMSMAVPVTLTVEPVAGTFFDDMPGQLGFSFKTGGTAPPTQTLQIRNGGAGTLNWTMGISTSDGGKWLSINAASGTAPSAVTVSVNAKNLPGAGLVPGVYTGQVVLDTTGDRVTVPVTVVLGANVFKQLAPLNFTKAYGGANPASQTLTVESTGTNFNFFAIKANGKGGSWLQITPSSYGCCGVATPEAVTVTVNAAAALAAGIYTGEVLMTSSDGGMAQTIPINLTVAGTGHVSTPTFTPPAGTYTATQSVILADSTPGSSIFYTIDGTTPTTSSLTYSVPIVVAKTQTIKAISVAPGYVQSSTATAAYTINAPQAGTPAVMQTITISEATKGATVYYTTDGTVPTTKSKVYTAPLVLSVSSVLKFIAVAPDFTQSAVRTIVTTIQ